MTWQNLVTCALLGTERQAPELPAGDDALGQLFGRLDGEDREGLLLRAAGVTALWRRAGHLLAHDPQPLPSPCEPDAAPACGPRARQHLALLLQGRDADPVIMLEWLETLGAAGQRVPDECLPALLDAGARRTDLRPALLPVLGRRGRWLAQHNADWSYAIEADDETLWLTGRFEERLALLRQWRATRPERALELLNTTWGEDRARQRRELLEALTAGLSMADEPFLENALDDRSVEVARAAADLLARLPESRLVQRLTTRALQLARFQPGRFLKRDRLEVDLPEDDAALRRDGIAEPPPAAKLGEKAWRLSRIVGAVPPTVWCRQWQRTPAEILILSRNHEWRQALLDGWVLATQRHRDVDWAEALLPLYLDHDTLTAALADVLPPARFEAYLLALLREASSGGRAAALVVLSHVARPWSVELGRAVLEQVRQRVGEDKQPDWWLAGVLRGFARWVPPELGKEAATGWPTESKQWPQWQSAVNDFLDRLRFRRTMRKAIAE